MKPSLQLKLTQHLALTPQLQQSIRLLQLSTLELEQELEKYLLENPLLEREEEYAQPRPNERARKRPPTGFPRARRTSELSEHREQSFADDDAWPDDESTYQHSSCRLLSTTKTATIRMSRQRRFRCANTCCGSSG
jgi:RNA polymerase sigma-54 factor